MLRIWTRCSVASHQQANPPPADHLQTKSTSTRRSSIRTDQGLIQLEQAAEQKIEIPGQLVTPHRLLKERLTELRSPKVDNYGAVWSGKLWRLNLRVSPSSLDRALRILNTLFYALESRGYQLIIQDQDGSSLCVHIDGGSVHFGLQEKFRRIDHPDQKNDRLEAWQRQRYAYLPTGELFLKVTEWWTQGLQKTWSDRKTAKLETCLNDFIIGLIKIAQVVKAERLRREEEHRARLKAEEQRLLEERKRQEERTRRNNLIKEAAAWTQAQQVRAYIAALMEKIVARHGEIQPGSQPDQWISWASRQADRLDPLGSIGSSASSPLS